MYTLVLEIKENGKTKRTFLSNTELEIFTRNPDHVKTFKSKEEAEYVKSLLKSFIFLPPEAKMNVYDANAIRLWILIEICEKLEKNF